MIEKILERFREASRKDIFDKQDYILLRDANKIMQEVAKEYAEIAKESRKDFMEIVYSELEEDEDNYRANRIIDAFDTYAPYQKEVAKDGGWIPCSERLPEYKWISVVHWATLRNKAGLVCTRKMRWCGNGKWIWVNGHDLGSEWEVIAWKPYEVPEPWKGGE